MSWLSGRKALWVAGAGLVAIMAIASVPLVSVFSAHAAAGAPAAPKASRPDVFAAEHPHADRTGQGNATSVFDASCNAPAGTKVIDVVESITNDADSGIAGDYWAFDNYTRRIQVWNVGPDMWCAVVTNGIGEANPSKFQAIAGQQSPGNGGILTGDEHGTFQGGYEATFSAQLSISDPANWPLDGRVGPVNYSCDQNANCPGYVDWTSKYFQNVINFQMPAWGWIYTAADRRDGVWINAATGSSGDILDQD